MLLLGRHDKKFTVDLQANFKINANLKIEYRGRYYSTRIEDISPDYLVISWPTALGRYICIKNNDPVKLLFIGRKGLRGVQGRILGGEQSTRAVLRLAITSDIDNADRRQYVRVPDTSRVDYRIIDPPIRHTINWNQVQAKNLSGSGVLLMVPDYNLPMPMDMAEVQIYLKDRGTISCKGVIARVSREGRLSEIGIHFTEITRDNRTKIIQHADARQVELRKAGLI